MSRPLPKGSIDLGELSPAYDRMRQAVGHSGRLSWVLVPLVILGLLGLGVVMGGAL